MIIPETPSLRLDGRRALVTGASRGLGLASAAALAQAGAEVVITARSAPEIEDAAAAIRKDGGSVSAVALDVTDLVNTRRWFTDQDYFDILVNNAGTNRPAAFIDTLVEDYDEVFSLNVRAAFFVAQSVARKLVTEGRRGSIINMSSQMGHVGVARRAVYCATKHALEGLTKALAAELGPSGIRVNTICPTFVETPLTRPFLEDEPFHGWVLSKIKLGRVGQPQDVMGAVVFLASDASSLMTGSALMLDGGWTTTS
jgi:NAD(P)-dependent dehydrogenase (short-subunit alcohol dehydrogenase family)